jgi:hypothetical protein
MSDSEGASAGSDEPTAAATRIGNGEREAAVAALRVHHTQGRLDSREYENRAVEARQARTWADLDPLFLDLPDPKPVAGALPAPSAPQPVGPTQLAGPSEPESAAQLQRGSLVPEPWATWLMTLTPFAALIVFFATGNWEWFLAIPIAGVIIYGPRGSHRDRDRRRNR